MPRKRRAAKSRQPVGKRITRGGRKIRGVLDLLGLGIVEFAEKADVSRVTLYHVMTGKRWRNISVDFAFRVSRASVPKGQSEPLIAPEDFFADTATPVDGADEDKSEEGPPAAVTGTAA